MVLVLTIISASIIYFRPETRESCESNYEYLSNEINCIDESTERLNEIENKVNQYIDTQKDAEEVSVFFRDLKTRRWFGIHENKPFVPASLLKVPLAITYFKYSEINPNILKETLIYKPKSQSNSNEQTIKPAYELKVNEVYSVAELIERMVKYSDNEPAEILSEAINPLFIEKVFVDLGVYTPTQSGLERDHISVKTYGAILRMLYISSYLNRETSNKLLEIMASSSFKDGLVSGLPSEIVVANKFGEKQMFDRDRNYIEQFHDCGIIYHKKNPYILCIMTQGKNQKDLIKVIKTISNIVFGFQSE